MILLLLINITASTGLYNQANAAYESGDYYQAIELYQEAGQFMNNSKIFYNLGNAYFKTGQFGRAIKNYRLAYFLSPRDPDIMHNLLYARAYRVDKVNPGINPIVHIFNRIFRSISLYEAQILSAILFSLIALLIAGYIVFRQRLYLYICAFFAVLILICLISWGIWSSEKNRQPAVVIAGEASALSGPAEDYREIVKVHDGSEASIRDERNGYYLIQLPGGIGGWIKKDAAEEIF